jgi:hypothetical protein
VQGNVVATTNALGDILEKTGYDIYGRITALWVLGEGDITPVNGLISAASYYSSSLTKKRPRRLFLLAARCQEAVREITNTRKGKGDTRCPSRAATSTRNPANWS